MNKFEQAVRAEWPEKADTILGLIRGTIDPDSFKTVSEWVRQCYHAPGRHDRVALALNEVIEGFGVEALIPDGAVHAVAEYINVGDTYDTTLVHTGRGWRVTSWGDYVEARGL